MFNDGSDCDDGEEQGKWVRRDVCEQRAVLTRFAASGVRVGVFCRREGISAGSLYRWQARHGKPTVERSEVTPPDRASAFVDLGALGTVSPTGQRLEVKLDLGEGLVLHLVHG